MPDCSECRRPLGRFRLRCHNCGACEDCCQCDIKDADFDTFDADELGLDPETHDVAIQERKERSS